MLSKKYYTYKQNKDMNNLCLVKEIKQNYSFGANNAEQIKRSVHRYLSFSKQLDSVINKAKQCIYLILKSFVPRDIKLLVAAYKT